MRICPNCGEVIKEGSDVCENCGALSSDLQNLLDELSGKGGEKENKNKKDNVELAKIDVSNYIDKSKEEKVTEIEGLESKKEDIEDLDNDENSKQQKNKESFVIPVVDEEEIKRQYKKKMVIVSVVVALLLASLGTGYAYTYFANTKDTKKETKKVSQKTETKKDTNKEKTTKTDDEKAQEKLLAEAKKKEAEKSSETTQPQTQQKNYLENANDTPNADGTYNDEPAHMYEEDVAPGDARLYWVSDRTLTDEMASNVAKKFGASWTVTYIYAKHGLIVDGYTKYGFSGDTSDKSVVESRFNGAERRNVKKLMKY